MDPDPGGPKHANPADPDPQHCYKPLKKFSTHETIPLRTRLWNFTHTGNLGKNLLLKSPLAEVSNLNKPKQITTLKFNQVIIKISD
jgi:hypothetical protein